MTQLEGLPKVALWLGTSMVLASLLIGCRSLAGLEDLTFDDSHGGGGGGAGGGPVGTGGTSTVDCSTYEVGPDVPSLLIASMTVQPSTPIVFRVYLDPPLATLSALDADTHSTEVQGSQEFVVVITAESFQLTADGLSIPGEANPVTGTDAMGDFVLTSEQCSSDRICGTMSGELTDPIAIGVDGSTFVLLKESDTSEPYPINCAGDVASP